MGDVMSEPLPASGFGAAGVSGVALRDVGFVGVLHRGSADGPGGDACDDRGRRPIGRKVGVDYPGTEEGPGGSGGEADGIAFRGGLVRFGHGTDLSNYVAG